MNSTMRKFVVLLLLVTCWDPSWALQNNLTMPEVPIELSITSEDDSERELSSQLQEVDNRSGGWSSWSEWSACSRSCDGGASHQLRTCTSGSCRGEHIRYQICNMQIISVAFLAAVYGRTIPATIRIVEAPSSKTTLTGPDGSVISSTSEDGKVLTNDTTRSVESTARQLIAYTSPPAVYSAPAIVAEASPLVAIQASSAVATQASPSVATKSSPSVATQASPAIIEQSPLAVLEQVSPAAEPQASSTAVSQTSSGSGIQASSTLAGVSPEVIVPAPAVLTYYAQSNAAHPIQPAAQATLPYSAPLVAAQSVPIFTPYSPIVTPYVPPVITSGVVAQNSLGTVAAGPSGSFPPANTVAGPAVVAAPTVYTGAVPGLYF